MKNTEIIIKYLSGEMQPEEREKFMKELEKNPELKIEYESFSAVWKVISDQLTLEDGPDAVDREALIAEVMAEHDVQFYKQDKPSKKELAFRKTLTEAMHEARAPEPGKRLFTPRIISLISMAAAAAIIAFVVLLNPPPDLYELADAYYQPGTDAVFESISNTSRSDAGSAMAHFRQGDFAEARSIAHEEILKQPDQTKIQLLYALACYESGDMPEAERSLKELSGLQKDDVAETSMWYLALLYSRSSRKEDAKPILEALAASDGPYMKKAKSLLRKMK